MQRFTSALRLRAPRPSALPRTTPSLPITTIRNASTSAPKSAEGPSAESGGSRSKSAAESQSSASSTSANPGAMPDSLSDHDMRGRTGGGKPLDASIHAPAPPKVWNHAVSGKTPGEGLTEEQKAEVDEHNRDFEKKHDRANAAENDKVDKSFWAGRDGGSQN